MRSNLRQYFRFNIYNNNISKRNSESTSFISIVMIFTPSDVRVKQQQHTKNGVILARIHVVQTSSLLSESALLLISVAATTISIATASTESLSLPVDIVLIRVFVVTIVSQI
jgi:hypothetical protein